MKSISQLSSNLGYEESLAVLYAGPIAIGAGTGGAIITEPSARSDSTGIGEGRKAQALVFCEEIGNEKAFGSWDWHTGSVGLWFLPPGKQGVSSRMK